MAVFLIGPDTVIKCHVDKYTICFVLLKTSKKDYNFLYLQQNVLYKHL